MKYLFVKSVFLFMLCSHMGKSQQATSFSYIVTVSGDTIEAVIKSKKWDIHPKRVTVTVAGKTTKYRPLEIVAFSVDNRTFVSAYLNIDVSNHLPGSLDLDDPDPKFQKDSVFVELLVGKSKRVNDGKYQAGGTKDLYRYKDSAYKLHFFIAENGQNFQPLVFKKFVVYKGESSIKQILLNEEYKNQLIKFLSMCPNISNYVNVTGYEEGQLVSLFSFYYKCLNQ